MLGGAAVASVVPLPTPTVTPQPWLNLDDQVEWIRAVVKAVWTKRSQDAYEELMRS